MLKSAFRNLGVTSPWNEREGKGNPADLKVVKEFLKFVKDEQAEACVFLIETSLRS